MLDGEESDGELLIFGKAMTLKTSVDASERVALNIASMIMRECLEKADRGR